MRPTVERGRRVAAWLGVACLGLMPLSPLSAQEPKERITLKGQEGIVMSVAFSPDGKTIASGSDDKTLKLWDLATGKNTATLKGHEGSVLATAFSPDGKTIASGSEDGHVKLWDVASGKNTATLKGIGEAIHSVVFRPDGKTLASGGSRIKLWDVATGEEIGALAAPIRPQVPLGAGGDLGRPAFSPDGKTVVSVGIGPTFLLDVASGKIIATIRDSTLPYSVAFSPDGKILALGGVQKQGELLVEAVELWDIPGTKRTDR